MQLQGVLVIKRQKWPDRNLIKFNKRKLLNLGWYNAMYRYWLEAARWSECLTVTCSYLSDDYIEDGARLFSELECESSRGNKKLP